MKLVYGVGINDADYVVQVWETIGYVDGKPRQKLLWVCPDYLDWKHMLERCYSDKLKQERPTYKDAECIDKWLRLSLFKEWKAVQGNVAGKQLDKDIIVPGNKLYSPNTCAYISQVTNNFVTASDAARGEYPLGVCWHKRDEKFMAYCNNPFTKKREYLGYYQDLAEAHEAWRKRKHELAQLVAETESDVRVVEALKNRYSIEEWYK